MNVFDPQTRARLAREWMASSQTQEEFCSRRSVSPRALRQWVAKYCAGRHPEGKARAILDSAIAQLQALRAALDAEEACQVGREPVTADSPTDMPDRRADSEAQQESGNVAVPPEPEVETVRAPPERRADSEEEQERAAVALVQPEVEVIKPQPMPTGFYWT